MKISQQIRDIWQAAAVQLMSAFVLCLLVFAWLQPVDRFADPDTWYHIRLTTMMRDGSLVTDFPWTQASLYRDIFIDHHFLYHVWLLPFISLASTDLVGGQLATILFATLSAMTVVWCLWKWRVPYWGVGLLLLLTSAPFLFRLSLIKAPSLAIAVLFVAYYLMVSRRLGWLFWVAWFYVWFYSAWPLLVIMVVVYILVDAFADQQRGWRNGPVRLFSAANLKLAAVVAAGLGIGLLVNPYFPTNLSYLRQIFSMALVPYHNFVKIGSEWYPFNAFDLPEYMAYPLLVWFMAAIVAAFTWRRQTKLSKTTWIMSVLFLFYTLRARRQAEYFVPWTVLASGLSLRDSGLGQLTYRELKEKLISWLPNWLKQRSVVIALLCYAALIIPWGLSHGTLLAKALLAQGFGGQTLYGVSRWLQRNTPSRAVVFHSDWGTFPMLFYHNRHNYYLTGLDQTFMYKYDQSKYQAWLRIVKGENARMFTTIKKIFQADYLVMEKRTPAMLLWLNRDPKFVKVYEDAEAIVYRLTDQP